MKILRMRNITLADLLPGAVWDEMCGIGAQCAYSDSQLIEERGDAKDGISLVVSGEIAVGNVRRDGSFLVSGLLRQGECYGQLTAFLGLPQTHSLWAVGQTEVAFLNASRLASFLNEQPILYEALLKLSLWRNVEILDFLDAQRRLSLPLRIARLLLAAPAEGQDQSVIDCRQDDLADTLGVSRVAVGKALKKLEKERLIGIGYGKIILVDRRRLSQRIEVEQAQN